MAVGARASRPLSTGARRPRSVICASAVKHHVDRRHNQTANRLAGSIPRLHGPRDVPGQFRRLSGGDPLPAAASQHVLQLRRHDHAAVLLRGRLRLPPDVPPPARSRRPADGLLPRDPPAPRADAPGAGRLLGRPRLRHLAAVDRIGPLGGRQDAAQARLVPDVDAHRRHVALGPAGDSRPGVGPDRLHARFRRVARRLVARVLLPLAPRRSAGDRRRAARVPHVDDPGDRRHAGVRRDRPGGGSPARASAGLLVGGAHGVGLPALVRHDGSTTCPADRPRRRAAPEARRRAGRALGRAVRRGAARNWPRAAGRNSWPSRRSSRRRIRRAKSAEATNFGKRTTG